MLTNEDLSFTRIDLALDIKDNSIEFKQLLEYLNKNCIVTRFKKYKICFQKKKCWWCMVDTRRNNLFRSRSSNIFIRIYDKAKQMQVEGNWIRIEIVYKDDHANALALYIAQGEKLRRTVFSNIEQLYKIRRKIKR